MRIKTGRQIASKDRNPSRPIILVIYFAENQENCQISVHQTNRNSKARKRYIQLTFKKYKTYATLFNQIG